MKRIWNLSLLIFLTFNLNAQKDKNLIQHDYPISTDLRAVQFLTEFSLKSIGDNKRFELNISSESISIEFVAKKKKKSIELNYSNTYKLLEKGMDCKEVSGTLLNKVVFKYPWQMNTEYKVLIAKAVDTTNMFTIYSGYIWLPELSKWKFLACTKMSGTVSAFPRTTIQYNKGKKIQSEITFNNVWAQSINGSWKNLSNENKTAPIINLNNNLDSAAQRNQEIKFIERAINSGKTDVKSNEQGVYYTMMKEGNGKQVNINDTVTVNYKGYLFSNGEVFDETKTKPATFPLMRLIKGWQIGIPLCKVGGKIKLVIPSDMAYSIRTRSPKIPPNSILVFEIEVIETKSPFSAN
ncbi:MAG: FKBP-type peptidyl-prolyl cis-trans isomerase [Bacteroidetes bacterium]|nr:FKBP-type peptidyl-prolyl cis-trans isomerase [Bacteroidota bacterium]